MKLGSLHLTQPAHPEARQDWQDRDFLPLPQDLLLQAFTPRGQGEQTALSQAFSPTLAHLAAQVCLLSYLAPGAERNDYWNTLGLQERAFVHLGSTEATLLRSQNSTYQILLYRGTAEPRQWLTNLNAAPCSWSPTCKDQKVHRGFRQAYLRSSPLLQDLVLEKDCPTLLAGHSLGGALAILMQAHLRQHIPKLHTLCYTLGSPRIGNQAFCEAQLPLTQHHLQHGNDLVSQLPLPAEELTPWKTVHKYLPDWKRPGHQHQLSAEGILTEISASQSASSFNRKKLTASLRALTKSPALPSALQDHAPLAYLRSLIRSLRNTPHSP